MPMGGVGLNTLLCPTRTGGMIVKRMITVKLAEAEKYDSGFPPEGAIEFAKWLGDLMAQVPAEHARRRSWKSTRLALTRTAITQPSPSLTKGRRPTKKWPCAWRRIGAPQRFSAPASCSSLRLLSGSMRVGHNDVLSRAAENPDTAME